MSEKTWHPYTEPSDNMTRLFDKERMQWSETWLAAGDLVGAYKLQEYRRRIQPEEQHCLGCDSHCARCGMSIDGPDAACRSRVQLRYCNGCALELEQQSISAIMAAMPIEQVRKELKGARSDG